MRERERRLIEDISEASFELLYQCHQFGQVVDVRVEAHDLLNGALRENGAQLCPDLPPVTGGGVGASTHCSHLRLRLTPSKLK